MARDSLTALVALNRFGFGARGGASGDFVNAASDPRGFVKADLARPSVVLLELPGLQSTPALARALFEYQDEVKQAKAAQPASETAQPTEQKPRRSLSLSTVATDVAGQTPPIKTADNGGSAARCSLMRPSRHNRRRSRSTSSRRRLAPRRWRGCSARCWPIAASPSASWCSGPIISAFLPTKA